jgi:hypothetical protein
VSKDKGPQVQTENKPEPGLIISMREDADSKEVARAAIDAARAAGHTVQVLSTEQYAKQLELLGFYQDAEKVRGHAAEDTLVTKAKGFMKTSITFGDVAVVGLVVGGAVLIWEVAARWLDIPAMGWFKKKEEQPGQVRRLNTVAGSR